MKRGDELSHIVEAIKKVGPRNCSLISRMTGIPVETVRYKIRKQLMRKWVKFHVSVDYNKLGLVRNWVTLNFNDGYDEVAPKILDTLSKVGYLIYYGRVIPQGNYVSLIALPIRANAEYKRFLNSLIDIGALTSYEINELAWVRSLSMRSEYYNFSTGTWNIDWERLDQSKVIVKEMGVNYANEPLVDKIDLLILKEFQINSAASIAAIARKLRMEPKTIRYHYMEHIIRRDLIVNYIVRWQRDIERNERHSFLRMFIQFKNLMRRELLGVQNVFHRLPFTWFDALSSDQRLYLVYVTLPMTQYINALDYLRRNISGNGHKFEIDLIDPTCTKSYTIPYEMFDGNQGWVFDAEKTFKKLNVMLLIKR